MRRKTTHFLIAVCDRTTHTLRECAVYRLRLPKNSHRIRSSIGQLVSNFRIRAEFTTRPWHRRIRKNRITRAAGTFIPSTIPLSWSSDFDVDGRTVNLAQNQKFETGRPQVARTRAKSPECRDTQQGFSSSIVKEQLSNLVVDRPTRFEFSISRRIHWATVYVKVAGPGQRDRSAGSVSA